MKKSELKTEDEPLKKRPCRRCGSCCRAFAVTLNDMDLRREPRLVDYAVSIERLPVSLQGQLLKEYEEKYAIQKPCPFVFFDSGLWVCRIYRTRPDTCRRYYPSEITCNVAKLEEQGVDTFSTIFKMIGQGHAKADVMKWMAEVDPKKLINKLRRLVGKMKFTQNREDE